MHRKWLSVHLTHPEPRSVGGEVVDDQGDPPVAHDVAPLLGARVVAADDVDGAGLRVDGEPDRPDLRGTVRADGGHSAELLGAQV